MKYSFKYQTTREDSGLRVINGGSEAGSGAESDSPGRDSEPASLPYTREAWIGHFEKKCPGCAFHKQTANLILFVFVLSWVLFWVVEMSQAGLLD
jgi:hypothetical protein